MKAQIGRVVLVFMLVLSALGFTTTSVYAGQQAKDEYKFTISGTTTDLCAFPIDFMGQVQLTEILIFDQNQSVQRVNQHWFQQDTFSANGKTLVGLPYTTNTQIIINDKGELVSMYSEGGIEKVPLPDGSIYLSAGRIDWLMHLGAGLVISADTGKPGDMAAFCAALAP